MGGCIRAKKHTEHRKKLAGEIQEKLELEDTAAIL